MECRHWWDKGLGLKSGNILSTSSELLSLHMNWNIEGVAFEILTPFSWFWALHCWDGVCAFPWVSGESPGIVVLTSNWDVDCILHIRNMDGKSFLVAGETLWHLEEHGVSEKIWCKYFKMWWWKEWSELRGEGIWQLQGWSAFMLLVSVPAGLRACSFYSSGLFLYLLVRKLAEIGGLGCFGLAGEGEMKSWYATCAFIW